MAGAEGASCRPFPVAVPTKIHARRMAIKCRERREKFPSAAIHISRDLNSKSHNSLHFNVKYAFIE
jgi:hypothetical protein